MLVNIGEIRTRHVEKRKKCGTIDFQIFKYIGVVLNIETHIWPVQIDDVLNPEGVELPFN
jgi:hypothetical protein